MRHGLGLRAKHGLIGMLMLGACMHSARNAPHGAGSFRHYRASMDAIIDAVFEAVAETGPRVDEAGHESSDLWQLIASASGPGDGFGQTVRVRAEPHRSDSVRLWVVTQRRYEPDLRARADHAMPIFRVVERHLASRGGTP